MPRLSRALLTAILPMLALAPVVATRAAVHPRFDLSGPDSSPFPSNQFAVPDERQRTGLRVRLPMPPCDTQPSDCEELALINQLDGFNVQPRLSVPFDGGIDVHSVSSESVFLVSLTCADSRRANGGECGHRPRRIGIDQVVWDTFEHTLHVESDELLDQNTTYALIVTDAVRDSRGEPIGASAAFRRFRSMTGGYKHALLDAIQAARRVGIHEREIAVASVFTTQSVTATLEQIRHQIKAAKPPRLDLSLGPGGTSSVFPLATVASVSLRQQTGAGLQFAPVVTFNLADLRSVPGAVGEIAFGRFPSLDYQVHPGDYIPIVPTRTGNPRPTGENDIYVNLIVPAGPRPARGWPVVIAGHAGGGSKEGFTLGVVSRLAAALADRGIATIAINGVGHGLGPLGTLSVTPVSGPAVTFSAGGRSLDQNQDGAIENREGSRAAAPRTVLDDADALRQTAIDLMHLVRVIEGGVDVDGDTTPDLDRSRVYYVTQSYGGFYGSILLGVEPGVRAAVLNATGGPKTALSLSTSGGRLIGAVALNARTPSLINTPGVTSIESIALPQFPAFFENMPLRGGEPLDVTLADGTSEVVQSPVVNRVTGAMAIQAYVERAEWLMQSASPVAYARYFRQSPLPGMPAKSVIIQFAKGDQTAPNPSTTAMIRAGRLRDRATYYRHDVAFAENPLLPKNPHGFGLLATAFGTIAHGAQEQIVEFFASNGERTIHPEPAHLFETPIDGRLPESLGVIP